LLHRPKKEGYRRGQLSFDSIVAGQNIIGLIYLSFPYDGIKEQQDLAADITCVLQIVYTNQLFSMHVFETLLLFSKANVAPSFVCHASSSSFVLEKKKDPFVNMALSRFNIITPGIITTW
jgi:hypothetical protein